jgi:hypothetical protein
MADMVVPNEGKALWLDRMLRLVDAEGGDGWEVALYDNNYTPIDTSSFADFDLATFTGGDPIAIADGDWPASNVVANVALSTLATPPSWTCTGGGPDICYGWLLYGVTSGKVYAAQRFDSARTMDIGATETLDPYAIKLKTFV